MSEKAGWKCRGKAAPNERSSLCKAHSDSGEKTPRRRREINISPRTRQESSAQDHEGKKGASGILNLEVVPGIVNIAKRCRKILFRVDNGNNKNILITDRIDNTVGINQKLSQGLIFTFRHNPAHIGELVEKENFLSDVASHASGI